MILEILSVWVHTVCIFVLSDPCFQREIIPVAPSETTFLLTSLFPPLQSPAPSVNQTSLSSHYKHAAATEAVLSKISTYPTVKGVSLLSFSVKASHLLCYVHKWLIPKVSMCRPACPFGASVGSEGSEGF